MINKHIQKFSASNLVFHFSLHTKFAILHKNCYLKHIQACAPWLLRSIIILTRTCLNFVYLSSQGKWEISQGKVREFWYLVWVATLTAYTLNSWTYPSETGGIFFSRLHMAFQINGLPFWKPLFDFDCWWDVRHQSMNQSNTANIPNLGKSSVTDVTFWLSYHLQIDI